MRLLTILIVVITATLRGQENVSVNLYKSTQLIFQDKIVDYHVGTENVLIEVEIRENIAILKAVEEDDFVETNLYVSTKSGYHYNFIINYDQDPKNQTRLISLDNAIVKPTDYTILSKKEKITRNQEIEKGGIATQVVNDKRRVKRMFQQYDKIILRYVNHYYQDQKLYYKLEIENKSNQDFQIEFIKFFKRIKPKGSRKSDTRKAFIENQDYELLLGKDVIGSDSKETYVYQFNKFSLNKEQKLLIDLKEKNGNRDMELLVDSRLTNDPLSIKN